ncbi:zf-TFIIB domain-containing protein [Candidatus Woesearchaeota archaeon]|nr:zf-TFIIB domain-containing protein [Candidatus Woesearchaeota archaeon]
MFNLFRKQKKGQYAKLKCPRCNIVMRKLVKQDVVIDICEKCNGMWLDDNEINKLIELAKPKKGEKKNGKKKD